MLFQRLSTSNTFSQWVTETQKTVGFVNELTDGYRSIYANTNVVVGEDLHVNGNVLVTGTFILDEIDFDDLTIAGNLTVDKAIVASNAQFENLNVVSDVATVNATTDVIVGQNAFLYGNLNVSDFYTKNLTVSGNFDINNINVTASNVTITIGQIDGALDVTQNATLGNTTITYGNMETANIYKLVGPANTQIYNTIEASNGIFQAAEQRGIFIGLAIALG